MCAVFSPEEENLFEKTGASVFRRLRKTRNPSELLSVVASGHKEFDRAYDSAPLAARESVACRAGCGTCCHVPVGVQAHEVLIVAQHVQTHFSPLALEQLIERTAVHHAAFSGQNNATRIEIRTPCALLHEGSCTVYEARPEACRSHHSNNVEACITNLASGREDLDVYIPDIRGRMFAIMLSIDQAVAEAGYDGRAYDFGSALHEALTDSRCAMRWMQRKPAFPDVCREGTDGDDEDSGVIHAEGFFQ